MSRLEREIERVRAEAFRHPLTRANSRTLPTLLLDSGRTVVALTVNK